MGAYGFGYLPGKLQPGAHVAQHRGEQAGGVRHQASRVGRKRKVFHIAADVLMEDRTVIRRRQIFPRRVTKLIKVWMHDANPSPADGR